MPKILIGKNKIDLSNIRPMNKLWYPQFRNCGCYFVSLNRNFNFICKSFFIGLGKKCNEKNVVIILNHEVIHSIILRDLNTEVTKQFDNICPSGDLINGVID